MGVMKSGRHTTKIVDLMTYVSEFSTYSMKIIFINHLLEKRPRSETIFWILRRIKWTPQRTKLQTASNLKHSINCSVKNASKYLINPLRWTNEDLFLEESPPKILEDGITRINTPRHHRWQWKICNDNKQIHCLFKN
jgi:hypothetical protein